MTSVIGSNNVPEHNEASWTEELDSKSQTQFNLPSASYHTTSMMVPEGDPAPKYLNSQGDEQQLITPHTSAMWDTQH